LSPFGAGERVPIAPEKAFLSKIVHLTHLALISAALNLDRALETRERSRD
jgi:hypothetical protein